MGTTGSSSFPASSPSGGWSHFPAGRASGSGPETPTIATGPSLSATRSIAEPWAFDLKTGQQRTRTNPVSGVEAPWQFLRPGHHCGAISACPQMLLMRSGFTAYYDLLDDSGIRHFAGQRPGCWINAIAADGLALIPEASAGCLCLFPITCSLALEPRKDHSAGASTARAATARPSGIWRSISAPPATCGTPKGHCGSRTLAPACPPTAARWVSRLM